MSDSASYPHQLYNITTVSISVLDLNDNPPQFPKATDNISIAENSPSGTLVTRVTATDRDHDANARISYTLSHDNGGDYFRIDAITGEIFVTTTPLDYETTHYVMVTLTAEDAGLPSLSGTMKLRIDLIDVNDNAPVMSKGEFPNNVNYEKLIICTVLSIYIQFLKNSGLVPVDHLRCVRFRLKNIQIPRSLNFSPKGDGEF